MQANITGIIDWITNALNWINNLVASLIGNPHLVTKWWVILLIGLGFAVFESIFRRWFGGGFDYRWLRWLNHRFIKHTINILAIFAICYWVRGMNFLWGIYFAGVLQGVFWTPTFGLYFDMGRSYPPIPPEVQEYKEQFFAPLLDWIFPESQRYTPYYDYMGMVFRFCAPCLLLFWVATYNSGMILMGFWVAMMYGLGWVMQEKSIIKKIGATEFGEFASGAFVGWMIVACGMLLK